MGYPYTQEKIDHGSKSSISTSAVQIIVASRPCKVGVIIKADDDNSGDVYIGNSDVTAGGADATDGFRLTAGDGMFIEVDDANMVYAIGSAAGQKLYFLTV